MDLLIWAHVRSEIPHRLDAEDSGRDAFVEQSGLEVSSVKGGLRLLHWNNPISIERRMENDRWLTCPSMRCKFSLIAKGKGR